jgi:hypothetical protein
MFTPTCDRKTPYDPTDRAFPIVRCGECYTDVPGKDFDASGNSAIKAWNRRAPYPSNASLVEENERLRKAEAERDALRGAIKCGYWEASVYHCPPPRSKRDNPLKHSSTMHLPLKFISEDAALGYAAEVIRSGWANTTIVHRESAKPIASFVLSRNAIDALGRAALNGEETE